MNWLLDTHICYWWYFNSSKLSPKQVQILEKVQTAGESVGLSAISLWEFAKLVSSKKIELTITIDEWFEKMEEDGFISIIPLNGRISLESTRLGSDFHKDPADQIITATARVHGLKLITNDRRIIASGLIAVL